MSPPASPTSPRSFYLDNLRIYLIILVIYHHTAIPYGGLGSWAYTSSQHTSGSSPALITFNVLNQTYFMASLFLLSGYFSALASRKRKRTRFLVEKTRRLGVPTLVYTLVAPPVQRVFVMGLKERKRPDVWRILVDSLKSIRGVRGPVWYCATLLVFDVVYACARPRDFRKREFAVVVVPDHPDVAHDQEQRPPTNSRPWAISTGVLVFGLVLTSLVDFSIRIWYPTGKDFPPLNVQLAYLPQYILFYVVGLCASRMDTPLHSLLTPRTRSHLGLLAAFVVVLSSVALGYQITCGAAVDELLEQGRGGWNIPAFVYAVWNEVVGAFLASVVLSLFHKRFDDRWTVFSVDVARYSYPAFLVHAPVLVFWQSLVDKWRAARVVKTLIVGGIGVISSWNVGGLLARGLDVVGLRGLI